VDEGDAASGCPSPPGRLHHPQDAADILPLQSPAAGLTLPLRSRKDAQEMERMDYLEFVARVTSHIPDKGQVTVRYYGLYANAHRGKVKKASQEAFPLRMAEEELRRLPAKGWAEMIRKVYEVDPLTCVRCGGTMKIIAFLTDYAVVDRIIDHLKLGFVAERPPPPQIAYQEVLMAAETSAEYYS